MPRVSRFRYLRDVSHRDSDGLADLPAWRTFLAVHRAGSVSGAARALGVAQSTVTGHLQAIERSMGERLFERRARGVVPTARADQLAARLAGPLDALAEVLAGATDAGRAPERPVRLGGPAEFLAEVAMPAVGPLVADGVRLHVTPGVTADLLDALRAGHLDLVVATSRPAGRTLAAEVLGDEELVLVGAQRWAGAAEGAVVSTGSTTGPPLLAWDSGVPLLRRYWRHVLGTRLEREPDLVVPDLRALRAAARAGAGVTVLPRYLCEADLASGALHALLQPEDPPVSTTFLVRRAGVPDGGPGREHLGRVRQALLAATNGWR